MRDMVKATPCQAGGNRRRISIGSGERGAKCKNVAYEGNVSKFLRVVKDGSYATKH